jgi:hemerythrin-like domain-containing protein
MAGHILEWQAEHANYRRLLDLLDTQTGVFTCGDRPDYELMADVIHYMTQYPDHFHHPREDAAFARLRSHDPAAGAIVAELAGQHERIRRSGAMLAADLAGAADGAMMPRARIAADVRDYATLLRTHMEQEEREVFPRLAALLTTADWFLIDSAIHFRPDPLFGDRVQARFAALHRRIADRAGCGCTAPAERVCCVG